jgi:hypothetical protein
MLLSPVIYHFVSSHVSWTIVTPLPPHYCLTPVLAPPSAGYPQHQLSTRAAQLTQGDDWGADSRCTNGSVARSSSEKHRLGEVSSAIGFAISGRCRTHPDRGGNLQGFRAGAQHYSESEPRAEYAAPEAHRASAAEILHLAGPGHRVRGWSNTGDSPTRMA